MKSISRVLAFGLPLAAAIATISSGSAFAQVTSLPFTGTVSGTVFTNGAISLNGYSLLSPIGTISATTGTITSLTTSTAPNINVGSILTASGTTTGGVVFSDGKTASFVAAPTTVTSANVTSISSPLVLGVPRVVDINVSLQINSGNITIPTSSIVAAPVTPITTPTVIVQSPGIASALVILDPAFIAANPGISSGIVTAFSSDPSAAFSASPGTVYSSSLSSKVSPFLN